ncbi:DUF6618 family protein [Amedibacillus sp. YH-ame6]
MKAKVNYARDCGNCYELSIDCNGFNFIMIIGRYINGGFFAIINHGVSGDLSDFTDSFWNAGSIGNALNNHEVGEALAIVIKGLFQQLKK